MDKRRRALTGAEIKPLDAPEIKCSIPKIDVQELDAIEVPAGTFEEMLIELEALELDPDEIPEIDFSAPEFDLMNDPDIKEMLRDSEKELAALNACDSSDGTESAAAEPLP